MEGETEQIFQLFLHSGFNDFCEIEAYFLILIEDFYVLESVSGIEVPVLFCLEC